MHPVAGKPFIKLDGITLRVGGETLFRNTDWEIRQGQHWAVIGPNGSGKSVLAETLMRRVPLVRGRILYFFDDHGDRPVPREELLTKVWGYARDLDIETRTVDIHIAKLRRKIEADPKSPRHLVTIRGAGYRLLDH